MGTTFCSTVRSWLHPDSIGALKDDLEAKLDAIKTEHTNSEITLFQIVSDLELIVEKSQTCDNPKWNVLYKNKIAEQKKTIACRDKHALTIAKTEAILGTLGHHSVQFEEAKLLERVAQLVNVDETGSLEDVVDQIAAQRELLDERADLLSEAVVHTDQTEQLDVAPSLAEAQRLAADKSRLKDTHNRGQFRGGLKPKPTSHGHARLLELERVMLHTPVTPAADKSAPVAGAAITPSVDQPHAHRSMNNFPFIQQ